MLRLLTLTALLFFTRLVFSAPYYGATLSDPLVVSTPHTLRGYQLMLNYDPDKYTWHRFNLYFDGGLSHFWITNTPYYTTLNIYSAAPVIRYSFKKQGPVLPFLEFSIGLSYLNHTHLDDRNFGIHFAFQDRFGVGALFGKSDQVSLGIHAVHYSNAHLSKHNSGITVPIALDIGYRFS